MTIGELLKQRRTSLGLTQKEFSSGVISAAHYSKVEHDKHEISANDLFLLLQKNHINFGDFYNELALDNHKTLIANNNVLISQAFYQRNKKKVKELNKKIQDSDARDEEKSRAILMQAILENKLDKIPLEIKNKIKRNLFEHDYWVEDKGYLRLLSNSLVIFNTNEIQFFFNQIFERYYSKIDIQDYDILKAIAAICINCLHITYIEGNDYMVDKIIKLFKKFPQVPDLFIYQVIKNYYIALFTDNNKKADQIKTFMKENGLKDYIRSLA